MSCMNISYDMLCIHTRTHIQLHAYICIYVCIYVHILYIPSLIYICTSVCMYIYIYIHTCVYKCAHSFRGILVSVSKRCPRAVDPVPAAGAASRFANRTEVKCRGTSQHGNRYFSNCTCFNE